MSESSNIFQKTLDHFMLTGLIEKSSIMDQKDTTKNVTVKWTPKGLRIMQFYLFLFSELHGVGFDPDGKELELIHTLAIMSVQQFDPANPEHNPFISEG